MVSNFFTALVLKLIPPCVCILFHSLNGLSPCTSFFCITLPHPHLLVNAGGNLRSSSLFWQNERIRTRAGRGKWRITDHFFCDLMVSGFSGETCLITSPKKYPDRPYWVANLLSYQPGVPGLSAKVYFLLVYNPVNLLPTLKYHLT